jgi:choline monooxygenase
MSREPDDLRHAPLEEASALAARFYIVPGRLQTNRVIPLGLDRCRVDFDYFYGDDGAARSDRDREFSDEIQREDIDICERVQRGLSSGGYVPGRLSPKREAGVWHFQNLLRDAYRQG